MRGLSSAVFLLSVLALPLAAGEAPLLGRIEGRTYHAAGGYFRVPIPVLPELGGRITDTENVVTFADDFTTYVSIASFPFDAAQRREDATRGRKEYLTAFFANFVLPDFQQRYGGTRVESARYLPMPQNGALLTYLLLPGGSMFADRARLTLDSAASAVAKRGNLLFVRGDRLFVLSMELAERVLVRTTYDKTVAEEDELLRQRLLALLERIEFGPAPAR